MQSQVGEGGLSFRGRRQAGKSDGKGVPNAEKRLTKPTLCAIIGNCLQRAVTRAEKIPGFLFFSVLGVFFRAYLHMLFTKAVFSWQATIISKKDGKET